ncbi:MAG: crossover junction endodeoxyribonuclease RuvC [Nitrospinota bacterium]
MIVLGIDPGNSNTGFSVVENNGEGLRVLDWGVIRPSPSQDYPLKLKTIFDGLTTVLGRHPVDGVVIENIFFAENAKTALKLGQVRGVAILAGASSGVRVFEYSALQIKKSVVGYGRASKEQVREMIRRLFKIEVKTIPFDASDALAAAVCHINLFSFNERVARAGKQK